MVYVDVRGTRVPSLGFGTWELRGEACREGVRDALEIGYRHLDTAAMYANETQVGQGMRDAGVPRETIFLTTKVWHDSLAPADVRRSAEESLRKLGVAYVDLLLIHWPIREIPVEQTLDAMLALQREGKTRHVGICNATAAYFERAAAHTPLFCNQVEYHPFLGQREALQAARRHGAMLTAYSPTARGLVLDDPTIREIAASHGKSPVQVALRWLVQQEGVCAIPKASSPEHRRSNFAIFDFELGPDEMRHLHALDRGHRLVSPGWALWETPRSPAQRLRGMLSRLRGR